MKIFFLSWTFSLQITYIDCVCVCVYNRGFERYFSLVGKKPTSVSGRKATRWESGRMTLVNSLSYPSTLTYEVIIRLIAQN